MDRDTAMRLDGYLAAIRASLDGTAHFMKGTLQPDEFKALVVFIGEAMGGTVELSNRLYQAYPDITPPELVSGSSSPASAG